MKTKETVVKRIFFFTLFYLCLFNHSSLAGEADVIDVNVKKGQNSYEFSVTVSHNDTGWDHFANKWEVTNQKGEILATRTLHHPHVNEQPFTRSLSRVNIPAGIKTVILRAHDSIHEYDGKQITVDLP